MFNYHSGNYNTAIGAFALTANTTGAENTAVGYLALTANTTGASNTAVGYQALDANTTGTQNTAVGVAALTACTTGNYNTAVGISSGQDLTSGSNNLFLGLDAGRSNSPSGSITTGSNNVVLGDNSIANLYCADTTISSSDARDKTDVQDFTHGLNWITQLRPVTYRWDKRSWYAGGNCQTEDIINAQPNGAKKRQQLHLGFLAQEELAVETQFGFGTSKDNMLIANLNEDESAYGLKYERLVPILVNAIKELSAKCDSLQAEINTLKGQ
jgi:trimeric autotransporter adhesin